MMGGESSSNGARIGLVSSSSSITASGVAAEQDIPKALESVSWDFSDSTGGGDLHNLHPYPAKFIPEIPRGLIRLFHPGDSSPVLDPFCGSGTTLVEAIRSGIAAWGIDLSPLACLIARVKTTALQAPLDKLAIRISREAQANFREGSVQVPKIPNLDHWFKSDIQQALSALIESIDATEPTRVREALRVAFSRIIVQVSNQESDTRYAAIEKSVSAQDVFNRFESAAHAVYLGVSSLSPTLVNPLGKATVLNRDTLSAIPSDLPSDIALVITSPPYPNAYEYWLYHKYRMYWLGMDPLKVRQAEIGARLHYFKKKSQNEHDFEVQMGSCFRLLAQVMRPHGKACFLVGRSIIHGREVDNVQLLARAARLHGFAVEGTVERRIRATRKAFNPTHGGITKEQIVVFGFRRPA